MLNRHFVNRKWTPATSAAIALAVISLAACSGSGDGDGVGEKARTTPVASVPAQVASAPEASGGTVEPVVPDYSNVSYEDAESAYNNRRYAEATEMFDSYVNRKPENPWGYYMLGLSSWKSGQLERAREALEHTLELDPTHVKSLVNLSRVLLEQDRAVEARERVAAALELDSGSAEVYRMLGRVQAELGQPDSAVEAYRVALSIDPNDKWSMNNMGFLLIQQERFDEALSPLARAVQLRPESPVFQNNLGIALERTGHAVAAADAYRSAVAADSTYGKATQSLARVVELKDDPMALPVDLEELAQTFERDVLEWRVAREVAER